MSDDKNIKSEIPQWPNTIYNTIKSKNFSQVCYVPDAGHSKLITLCESDTDIDCVTLTTEEEGVAMLLGTWLGGKKGLLLMQSSGVGNIINMLSLAKTCRYPMLMLVTMRGEWGEFNPWQNPMGEACRPVLEKIGARVFNVEDSINVETTISAAAEFAFNSQQAVAVTLSRKLIGTKNFLTDMK